MNSSVSVVLLAAGRATRMQSAIPKPFLRLGDKRILDHSIDLFHSIEGVQEIIVVCDPHYPLPSFVKRIVGGECRMESSYKGVSLATHEAVLVHDAARPCLQKSLVERLLACLPQAAAPALPIRESVRLDNEGEYTLLPREHLYAMQTPQLIHKTPFLRGYDYARRHSLVCTDDIGLLEHVGEPFLLIPGDRRNIKITYPEDLQYAESLLCTVTN